MNKYILADIASEKLKRVTGMVANTLPEEINTLETVLPSGRVRFQPALYQAKKLKKIIISKRSQGESLAGTLVMLIANNEYDLPFTLADITFDFAGKGKMFTAFQVRPLVKDEESTRKYVAPFMKRREAIDKLPSEPVTGYAEPGEFLKANPTTIQYRRIIPDDYTDEVITFAQQFFDIFLDIYGKAEPVRDAKRRKEMDTFRSGWNKHILEDDPSRQFLTEAFGRQTAELFYEYLVYL